MHTSAQYIGLHEAPPLKNICPPRGFFCFITHGCYLRTVCDVSCSQSRLHPSKISARLEGFFCFITHGCYLRTMCDAPSSKFSIAPAFDSRVVKFSVPASFPQTPPAPHTHTKTSSGLRAHTHPPSLEILARSSPPPPQGLHCQHLLICPCSLPTDLIPRPP